MNSHVLFAGVVSEPSGQLKMRKCSSKKPLALLVPFSSVPSVVNQQLLVTNEGSNLCKKGDKLHLKYIFVETIDFLLLWEFLSSLLHSIKDRWVKIVELADDYWDFHESYDIRGCYFSSSMNLFIIAKL